jgi:hypothetical protein
MTTLSLERIAPSSRKVGGHTPLATRLGRLVSQQVAAVRTSMDTAVAYEQARTPAAKQAVLDRFLARIGN